MTDKTIFLDMDFYDLLFTILVALFGIISIALAIFLNRKTKEVRRLNIKMNKMKLLEENIYGLRRDLDKTKVSHDKLQLANVSFSSRLLIIEKFAQSINTHLEIKAILNSLLQSLKKTINAKRAEIFLLDPARNRLIFAGGLEWTVEEMEKIDLDKGEGIIGFLSENSATISQEEINSDFHLKELAAKSKIPTLLAGSLTSPDENRVIGVVNISELEPRVQLDKEAKRLLSILLNLASLAHNNAELFQRTKMLANVDGLTKLYNHRYFQDFLREELERHIRYKRSLSIVISDIDYFKKFNDTYGHQVGDFVLKEVAKIFKANIRRKIDIAARYGGEEFVLVLPETNGSGALKLAERIRTLIQDKEFFFEPLGKSFHVNVSLGVATYPLHAATPAELIKKADDALYEAKESGRNRTCLAQ